jgi:hypothetical protein
MPKILCGTGTLKVCHSVYLCELHETERKS